MRHLYWIRWIILGFGWITLEITLDGLRCSLILGENGLQVLTHLGRLCMRVVEVCGCGS